MLPEKPTATTEPSRTPDLPEADESAVAREFERYLTTIASSFAARLDGAVKQREQEFAGRLEGVIEQLRRTRRWVLFMAAMQLVALAGLGAFLWWRFVTIRSP